MPETMTVLSGSTCSSASAFRSVLKIVKSPQPGHQVGCSLVLNSATVTIPQHLRRFFLCNSPQRIHNLVREERPTVIFQYPMIHLLAHAFPDHVGHLARLVVLDRNRFVGFLEN